MVRWVDGFVQVVNNFVPVAPGATIFNTAASRNGIPYRKKYLYRNGEKPAPRGGTTLSDAHWEQPRKALVPGPGQPIGSIVARARIAAM